MTAIYLVLLIGALLGAAVAWLIRSLISWVSFLEGQVHDVLSLAFEDPDSPHAVALSCVLDPATKALSIIVPAYNEEERLGPTLDETLSYLQRRRDRQGPGFTYEIIVVDDGSKDKTSRVALDFTRRFGFDAVRLLRLPQNRGKGYAVRRGMMCARGEYLLLMDADGATRVEDLERLEAALARAVLVAPGDSSVGSGLASSSAAGPAGPLWGAAFGSRSHLELAARGRRNALRNFLTNGFHALVTLVVGGAIRDTQCGFKLFTRRTAALLSANQRLQRWCFDVELLLLCQAVGVPVVEVQVQWTEMPGSKIRATSVISMAAELALLKVAYQLFGFWQIRVELEAARKKAQ